MTLGAATHLTVVCRYGYTSAMLKSYFERKGYEPPKFVFSDVACSMQVLQTLPRSCAQGMHSDRRRLARQPCTPNTTSHQHHMHRPQAWWGTTIDPTPMGPTFEHMQFLVGMLHCTSRVRWSRSHLALTTCRQATCIGCSASLRQLDFMLMTRAGVLEKCVVTTVGAALV